MVTAIEPDLATRFNEQGYAILRNFLMPEELAAARGAINQLVDRYADKEIAAGKLTSRLSDAPFETRLLQMYASNLADAPVILRSELHLAGLFDLFFNPRLLDLVEQFL